MFRCIRYKLKKARQDAGGGGLQDHVGGALVAAGYGYSPRRVAVPVLVWDGKPCNGGSGGGGAGGGGGGISSSSRMGHGCGGVGFDGGYLGNVGNIGATGYHATYPPTYAPQSLQNFQYQADCAAANGMGVTAFGQHKRSFLSSHHSSQAAANHALDYGSVNSPYILDANPFAASSSLEGLGVGRGLEPLYGEYPMKVLANAAGYNLPGPVQSRWW